MKVSNIKNNNIELSEYDNSKLMNIINLKEKGNYYNDGRTCYLKLLQPINISGIIYSYLKIKGCGALVNNTYTYPGNKVFKREDPHFGINDNAEPILVYSEDAPFGGILLSRAINEFDNFNLLANNNVSTLLPFAVYKYDDLYMNMENLGVSISLCEDNEVFRMHKLLWQNKLVSKDYLEFYKKVFELEFNYKTNLDNNDKVLLIKKIAKKYASEINKFSKCNLYIHSGGWSNIQYSFFRKNIVLIDLDSSRKIINDDMKLLLNCRDLISNIYRFFINLYNPNCIFDFDDKNIINNNYILEMLIGYFPKEDISVLEDISFKINKYYIDMCFNAIKKIEDIMMEISDSDAKKYELNILEFYDYSMKLIYPLFLNNNKKCLKMYKGLKGGENVE